MKLPYTKKQVLDAITIDGVNVIENGELVSLFMLLEQGTVDRMMAWQIVRMTHEGEIKCPLSLYGTLTVFSLSKDMKEFTKMYSQGCELLKENNIEMEEEMSIEDLKDNIVKQLKDALSYKKGKIKIKFKKKKNEKPDIFPNTDRFKDLN